MKQDKSKFYGGLLGATLPFITMIVMLITLTITKHTGLKCFWTAGVAALCVTFLLARDKKWMSDVTVRSLTDTMFATTTIIYILAGILSYMLRDSGLINGLLWMFNTLNIDAKFLPVATFLICVLISTACGTQGGTISTVTPIMFPLAIELGCEPALMLGAILSGAMFGDNLAPISDTTIASSGAFHANVRDVVRSRIKYSVIAGGAAAILFVILGVRTTSGVQDYVVDASAAKTLIMLIVPLLMIFMMLRGADLVPVLLVCNMLSFALNITMGFVPVSTMVDTTGPIVKGIEGMIGIIIFTVWIFIQNEFLKESGVLNTLVEKLDGISKSPVSAELISMVIIFVTIMMTGNGTASIVIAGPVVYELFKKFNIDRHRGANYLDGVACGSAAVLPWNSSVLILYGLASSTNLLPDGFSPANFLIYSFHAMGLLVVYFVCAISGLWRTQDAKNYN